MATRILILLIFAVILTACASTAHKYPETKLSPTEAGLEFEQLNGIQVTWGGTIVETKNLEQTTEIQVLSYPLTSSGEPKTGQSPKGRFIVSFDEFLEPNDYARGRKLTVTGNLSALHEGKVGEADYSFPVLTSPETLLWPRETAQNNDSPRVRFGIGVGSGGRSSMGIGIGF